MSKIQNIWEKYKWAALRKWLWLFSVFLFPPLKECVHISGCFGFVHLSSKSPCLEPEHNQTESSSHRETKVGDPVYDFKEKTEREKGAVY